MKLLKLLITNFVILLLNLNLINACDTFPPAPTLLTATTNCTRTINVTGTALPNNQINIYGNTLLIIGQGVADGAGNFNFNTTVVNAGNVTVTATQVSPPNCESVQSNAIVVTVPAVPSAPSIITAISGCAGFLFVTGTGQSGNTVTIFTPAPDGSNIQIGTGLVNESNIFNINTTVALSAGQNTIFATQTNTDGCISAPSDSFLAFVPFTPLPPTVVSAIADCSGIVNVQGAGEANNTINIFLNGNVIGSGSVDETNNFNINTTALNPGFYTLSLQQTNSSGCVSTLTDFTVTVPAVPAAPVLTNVTVTSNSLLNVIGNAQANAQIRVFADGTNLIGSGTSGVTGVFNFTTTEPLASGSHTITVLQVISSGCVSARSNPIVINISSRCSLVRADTFFRALRLKYGAI